MNFKKLKYRYVGISILTLNKNESGEGFVSLNHKMLKTRVTPPSGVL